MLAVGRFPQAGTGLRPLLSSAPRAGRTQAMRWGSSIGAVPLSSASAGVRSVTHSWTKCVLDLIY